VDVADAAAGIDQQRATVAYEQVRVDGFEMAGLVQRVDVGRDLEDPEPVAAQGTGSAFSVPSPTPASMA